MELKEYHINLSRWFRSYILYLTNDISDSELWIRFEHINSPGWNLLHLIAECELAILKIKPDHIIYLKEYRDFMFGSGGDAKLDLSTSEILGIFKKVYDILETEVSDKLDILHKTDNQDEILKDVLKTELDFNLHMMTTHIAMHCDALMKWRLFAGKKPLN